MKNTELWIRRYANCTQLLSDGPEEFLREALGTLSRVIECPV